MNMDKPKDAIQNVPETKWKNRIIGYTTVDPKTLVPNPRNWRVHPKQQKDAMEGALDDIGWIADITVNKNTGRVIDGHLRLSLALENNEKVVPIKVVDLTETEEATALATLDPISAMAKTDKGKLSEILAMSDAQNDKMRSLLEQMRMKAGVLPHPQHEEHEYKKVETDIQVGDIFTVGPHKIACGDSTDVEFVGKVMGKEVAAIVVTSPPYNAGHTPTEAKYGKDSKYKDSADRNEQIHYADFLSNYMKLWLHNSCYVFTNLQMVAGNKDAIVDWLNRCAMNLADMIIWDKQTAPPAMADNVLNSRFEFIFVHKDETPASRTIGTRKFRGEIPNVYSAPVQKQNRHPDQHNATFPLHLPTFLITTFTNTNEIVADPFLGLGTTIVACHKNQRIGIGIELNPEYCELAIQWVEEVTGLKRVKVNG